MSRVDLPGLSGCGCDGENQCSEDVRESEHMTVIIGGSEDRLYGYGCRAFA
jgi:hypothetical protein